MATKISKIQIFRRVVLGTLLIGLTVLTILHQKLQGIPSIDALDPFGGLETLFKYIAGGAFIKKIEPGNLILLGGIVVIGIVLSRFFCGWFCAFGALQAVFGWLGKKLFRRHFTVPPRLDRYLRWIKYPVLVLIIYFTWKTGELVIRPYDPFAAFGHLSAGLGAVWAEFAVGLVLLIATLFFSMLYERAFCKYLCPLGAFNAILSRVPLFRIKRNPTTCISCSKCDRVCPMNIDVSHPEGITSPECIACMECVTACPTKKNTLSTTLAGKSVRLGIIVALGFGIYIVAALVGQATGMLRFSAQSLQELSTKGSLQVADIKGSSTYASVAESFGIDLERLYREVGVDPKKVSPDTMLKDTGKVAGIDGFEADTVRVAVARILGVPYAGEKGTLSPESPSPGESKTDTTATKPGTASGTPSGKPSTAATVPASPSLSVPPDFVLEGTMTLTEVAQALHSTTAAVIQKLGLPENISVDKPLRDMKDQYGYTMTDLKKKIVP
jgi:ferredoxin